MAKRPTRKRGKSKKVPSARITRPARAKKPGGAPPAASSRRAALRAAPGILATVDFVPRQDDEDVSNNDDAELGNKVRMTAEQNDGAWVFDAADEAGERRRWLRVVPR